MDADHLDSARQMIRQELQELDVAVGEETGLLRHVWDLGVLPGTAGTLAPTTSSLTLTTYPVEGNANSYAGSGNIFGDPSVVTSYFMGPDTSIGSDPAAGGS